MYVYVQIIFVSCNCPHFIMVEFDWFSLKLVGAILERLSLGKSSARSLSLYKYFGKNFGLYFVFELLGCLGSQISSTLKQLTTSFTLHVHSGGSAIDRISMSRQNDHFGPSLSFQITCSFYGPFHYSCDAMS